MRRAVLIVIAAGIACLCAPSVSLAGTLTWNLASDFTGTPPGSNPDLDSYGGTPWSYKESQSAVLAPSHDPASFGPLISFGTGIRGGLAGWHDPAGQPLVAINPTGATITNGTASFPAGQVVLQPGSNRFAAVGWTAPISGTVQISGTVTQRDTGTLLLCTYATAWTLDHSGAALASGSGTGSFSKAVTLQRGDSIYFTLSNAPLGNASCDATGLALQITAPTTAPQVTLDSPANGAIVTGGQPRFSGTASSLLGASSKIIVRVYAGSGVSGSPVQTLTATRVGGSYSIGPSSPLPDGVYTAQAEQDDSSVPPSAGFSSANTFRLANAPPSITLDSLGSKPLLSATPTVTGTAPSARDALLSVVVYPDGGTDATPVRTVGGHVGSDGHFAVEISPGLPDGQYTIVAVQSSGGSGISAPMTFRIKAHAPAVTLDQPGSGARVGRAAVAFSGSAGTALGDSAEVTVTLWAGGSASGKSVGSVRVKAVGGTWAARWTRRLALGRYTAQASQSDDAGHTSRSDAHSFRVVAGPAVIGRSFAISRRGVASVAIGCTAVGQACTGDVLVLTVGRLQAVTGGPAGQLRVMFAYVRIAPGRTVVVRRHVPAVVVRALRHSRDKKLRVVASLGGPGSAAQVFSAVRRAKLAR